MGNLQADNWPKALKKTKQRQDVFKIIEESEKPLSASDIFEIIQTKDTAGYAKSTVYRTLLVLERYDMIEKAYIGNEEVASYTIKHREHMHYAICLSCNHLSPLKTCPFSKIELLDDDFLVTNHKVQLYGYCKSCKERL